MTFSRTIKTGLAAVAFTLGAVAATAAGAFELNSPSGTYRLDKTHASLTWKVNHLGLSFYTARFTDFDATVTLDQGNPAASAVTVSVDPMSLETDFPDVQRKDFDKELKTASTWFNAGSFPEITFASKSIEVTGPNTAQITGDVTLLGVTAPVTLETTMNGALAKHPFMDAAAFGISAVGRLKRSDFGMTHLIPNVGDEVEILIEAEFIEAK